MKLVKIIAIAAAACGVMISASCCSTNAESTPAPIMSNEMAPMK